MEFGRWESQSPFHSMVYSIEQFKTLLQTHSTPLDFFPTQEGGNFRICGESDPRFRIVRYDKKSSDMKNPLTKWLRSTVWDTQTNVPVCISPPKAEQAEQPPCDTSLLVQDFLDGTMVNVFWIQEGDGWTAHISTRSQLGASGNFYSQRSFAELFQDALNEKGISLDSLGESIRSVFGKESFVRAYFASFLLQHPEHRVVNRISKPALYAVHVGQTLGTGVVKIQDITESTPNELLQGMAIKQYPMTGFKKDDDYNSFVNGLLRTQKWFWQGLTFKDAQGLRWRMRNPEYLNVRALRGSEALPLERWLRLRRNGQVVEYVKCYPEERQMFWDFEQRFRQLTSDVFTAYCSVHKSHESKLTDHPKHISPCVFRLHAHYLEHLKPEQQTVKMRDCIEVINGMTLLEQKRLMMPRNEVLA